MVKSRKSKLGKVTVPEFVKALAEILGMPEGQLGHVARRQREAGLLSQKGHGRGAAAATSTDAALLLLTAMVNVSTIYSADIGRALRSLKLDRSEPDARHDVIKPLGDDPVTALAGLMDLARSGKQKPFEKLLLVMPIHPRHGLFVQFDLYRDAQMSEWAHWHYRMPEVPSGPSLEKVLSRVGPRHVHMEWKVEHWVIEAAAKALGPLEAEAAALSVVRKVAA